jgi:hypothetical protein
MNSETSKKRERFRKHIEIAHQPLFKKKYVNK